MKKPLKEAKKQTASKADSSLLSEEEIFARVDEAKKEINQGDGIRFSDPEAMKEWMKMNEYTFMAYSSKTFIASMVVVIKFIMGYVFIRWVGTHSEYDKIDCSTI